MITPNQSAVVIVLLAGVQVSDAHRSGIGETHHPSEGVESKMSVPIQWRTKKQRYSLQGGVCPKCSNVVFPPRGVCPYCAREQNILQDDITHSSRANGHHGKPVPFAMPVVSEHVAVTAAGDD